MDGELEGIWLSDANGDFGKASFRSFNDVDGFKIQVSDLTPTCTDSVCGSTKYKVSFKLTNPAYEQTIDVTTFTCATQNAGADVSVASGDEMFYFKDSALTEYNISLNGAANDVQVSTDSTQAGASATLSISFLTTQPYIEESWIILKVPKANVAYTSNNAGSAVSLVTSANAGSASISIGATSLVINDFNYEQGSGYNVDTWALATTSSGVLATG